MAKVHGKCEGTNTETLNSYGAETRGGESFEEGKVHVYCVQYRIDSGPKHIRLTLISDHRGDSKPFKFPKLLLK